MHLHNPLPVAIWHIQGELDGSNEQLLIEEVKRENRIGARYLVLDLSFVTCLNEAGLAALESAAEQFGEGEAEGTNFDEKEGIRERVKLLHVPEEVGKVLDETGSSLLFEVCSDLRQALHSFLV